MARELEHLAGVTAFVKAVHAGSIAKAAAALGVSAPAVSRSIARLEKALGARLLHRSTHGLAPTEEGALYFDQCRRPVEALREAARAVRSASAAPTGRLRVTSTVGFGRTRLLPLLPRFARENPGLEIDLSLDDHHADWIAERVDVAIRNGRMRDRRIVARRLAPMQLVVCGAPEYLARRCAPRVPEDLLRHDCINFRMASSGRVFDWEFESAGRRFSVAVKGSLTVNDAESTCAAALAGMGLAQLGAYQAVPHLRAGRLQAVLTEYIAGGRGHWLCYLRSSHLPARVRRFADFLVSCFGEQDFTIRAGTGAAPRSGPDAG